MEQLNRITVRGIVGNVRTSKVSDRTLAQLTVVTNYAYKTPDGSAVLESTWLRACCWEGKAISKDDLESLSKGSKVQIEGRLRNQRYTGEDGVERSDCEIIASSLQVFKEGEPLLYQM